MKPNHSTLLVLAISSLSARGETSWFGFAQAIGEQLGIARAGEQAVTGVELAGMDQAALRRIITPSSSNC